MCQPPLGRISKGKHTVFCRWMIQYILHSQKKSGLSVYLSAAFRGNKSQTILSYQPACPSNFTPFSFHRVSQLSLWRRVTPCTCPWATPHNVYTWFSKHHLEHYCPAAVRANISHQAIKPVLVYTCTKKINVLRENLAGKTGFLTFMTLSDYLRKLNVTWLLNFM